MAQRTIRRKTCSRVIRVNGTVEIALVTARTLCWCSRVHPVDVAAAAGHLHMLAGQREAGLIVIERGRMPRHGRMAGCTIQRERRLSVLRSCRCVVLLQMAGRTLHRRPLIDTVSVALTAGDSRMRTRQWELGLIVIKCRRSPGRCRMTGRAFR